MVQKIAAYVPLSNTNYTFFKKKKSFDYILVVCLCIRALEVSDKIRRVFSAVNVCSHTLTDVFEVSVLHFGLFKCFPIKPVGFQMSSF